MWYMEGEDTSIYLTHTTALQVLLITILMNVHVSAQFPFLLVYSNSACIVHPCICRSSQRESVAGLWISRAGHDAGEVFEQFNEHAVLFVANRHGSCTRAAESRSIFTGRFQPACCGSSSQGSCLVYLKLVPQQSGASPCNLQNPAILLRNTCCTGKQRQLHG